jgi:hypothetical protein
MLSHKYFNYGVKGFKVPSLPPNLCVPDCMIPSGAKTLSARWRPTLSLEDSIRVKKRARRVLTGVGKDGEGYWVLAVAILC